MHSRPLYFNFRTTYNWNIVCQEHCKTQIYFIIETKGITNLNDLRQHERHKMEYAKKLFDFIKDKNKKIKYESCKNTRTFVLFNNSKLIVLILVLSWYLSYRI